MKNWDSITFWDDDNVNNMYDLLRGCNNSASDNIKDIQVKYGSIDDFNNLDWCIREVLKIENP